MTHASSGFDTCPRCGAEDMEVEDGHDVVTGGFHREHCGKCGYTHEEETDEDDDCSEDYGD